MSTIEADNTDERMPLLSSDVSQSRHATAATAPAQKERDTKTIHIIIILLAQIVALRMSNSFMSPAVAQIEEAVLCQEHFSNVTMNPETDPRCKSTPAQSELSMLQGIETIFGQLPSIFTSVPFGLAAEKYGRRPVLLFCTFG
ncbi:hypothetical protein QQS21_001202 [Conoideocrella luteorostrata]|uniref:Major facilitator superfamily (MFS) profile domain-containing protein n=1 Tax=Conoideocrella luteorostrata TaxID=1105319 RepID=A0AAJ0G3J0_9HYPO|nr:hypothetical protein QQS21_001202 [Conoideocrella luteorostrata]